MTSRGLTPTRIGLFVVGALALLSLGALAGMAYTTPAVPSSLQPPSGVSTFPVGGTAFDDARTVKLLATRGSATDLTSPADGRVTKAACSPGTPIVSGTSPLSVDGAPIIALSTPTPLWRDLARGDTGDDVAALQQELVRLGYSASTNGKLDGATLKAFNQLRQTLGETSKSTTEIPIDRLLWLPAAVTEVEACPVSLGSMVTAGDEVAVVPGLLTSISIIDAPVDLIDGPRVLMVDGTSVEVDPTAPIIDPKTLLAIDDLPSLQLREDSDEPAAAQLVLAAPIQVSVVPPSAVVGSDVQSCVVSDGNPMRVRVVGSEFGQSFVAFEGAAPATVDVSPSEDAACG